MKKKIKNYLVFTSLPYRILMLVVLPLCLLAIEVRLSERDFFLAQMIVVLFFVIAEVIADNWVFGGVAVKNGKYLEYLKCSRQGSKVMKTALTVNMLRQLITIMVLMVLGSVISGGMENDKYLTGKQVLICVNMVLMGCFLITVQLMLTRILEGALMSLTVACVGALVVMGSYYVVARFYLIMLPVLVVLSILASVLSIKIVMRRMEESFYDRAV